MEIRTMHCLSDAKVLLECLLCWCSMQPVAGIPTMLVNITVSKHEQCMILKIL